MNNMCFTILSCVEDSENINSRQIYLLFYLETGRCVTSGIEIECDCLCDMVDLQS